jgi:UDP-N-acetylmuramoyl-tripeptide--D-alanyl-D-alanine ligase
MIASTETIYSRFTEHPCISTDSRNVFPGSIFFALKGDNFNGNEYAQGAIDQGAAFAVVDDQRFRGIDRFLVVENVLQTLQALALHHRKKVTIPIIAITGTNGKTTTKELISTVLSKRYRTLSTSGNLNNHIGVPLTLLKITQETEIAVVEMGANHPGEIDFLCRIADPDFGMITNIGKAHLEGFGGYEGVISTKTELYRYLRQKNGTIFINTNDSVLQAHATGMKAIGYGVPPAIVVSLNVAADPFAAVTIQYADNEQQTIHSQLYGLYNSDNILAAACIGDHFGVAHAEIQAAIEAYQPVNNRSQIVKTQLNTVILDAYNANPTSMAAALASFASSGYAEKTIILGDMLELGEATDEEHLDLLKSIEEYGFEHVYLVGPVFTRLNTKREYICFHDSDLARMWFEHHKIENATVLIKGSRGIHLEKVAERF